MPLPLIIGAAALAAAGFGVKKGYDGHQKHSEADDIVKLAKETYDGQRQIFDKQEKNTQSALEQLGTLELEIGHSFSEFKALADSLIKQINAGTQDKLKITFPKRDLQKIETYSYSAVGVLGSIAGAGVAGAAAGFAVYGGVMALGAASTGTAISSLAGAAATNATLAALGGGSLAAGGLGVAGGTAILGAAVASPVLAIAGWAYDSHGEEALKNARKVSSEVEAAVAKLKLAGRHLGRTERYAEKLRWTIGSTYAQFQRYFQDLKDVGIFIESIRGRGVDEDREMEKLGPRVLEIVENGYALAAILTNIITTPLFKLNETSGQTAVDENGVPQLAKDKNGFTVLNEEKIDEAIDTAKQQSAQFS
ncbi:chemotaxis protein [Achromobacter dolens]|uniref:chemotaxis protein n=1 Tax=Achromobacter dolens TaxID=1287738 RepID=UPI000A8A9B26|nr:chemotaxis protein [Achromobacter dolens]